ncbi:MAG: quinolinate synthase NadA [Deltaproteobacteria bacterium]|nr:quinolinate synthase NadA [Deltaproteobacteria bacterium]
MDNMNEKEIIPRINKIKKSLGDKLIILTHHYQRKEIVDLGDYKGDSFDLSQKAAADKAAQYIVFCGVHFMAESAEILSQPYQTVQIPVMDAGCWMADMADIFMVEKAWEEIASVIGPDGVVPIVYMNSDANLKAFCGRNGGVVCTSSNATAALEWGYSQKNKILFFPDQHLGRNTGNQMGIPSDEMIVWSPNERLGGHSPEDIQKARLILWDGYCLVHTRFQVDHIRQVRRKYPDATIVVHPECTEEVVALADAAGSTSFIVKYVENAPANSTIVIGTEVNLVHRLALEYPDKKIFELHYSLCPNMFKTDPESLLRTLENIGQFNMIHLPEAIKEDSRLALDRMLTLTKK